MKDATNPYTPPTADLAVQNDETLRLEAIRREHINHEASIRSVGLLYYLSAFAFLLLAVSMFASGIAADPAINISFGIVYLILFFVLTPLARGLRKLSNWVRIPVTILSALGLLGFPIGTLINGYIIYLVWCKKGEMVFSTQYQEVIEQTPHIKYRTSILIWILLAFIIGSVLAAILIPAIMSS